MILTFLFVSKVVLFCYLFQLTLRSFYWAHKIPFQVDWGYLLTGWVMVSVLHYLGS